MEITCCHSLIICTSETGAILRSIASVARDSCCPCPPPIWCLHRVRCPMLPQTLLRRLGAAAQPMFLDRAHSILAFNERVFDWAVRGDVPLRERLRYLWIVSPNLDEFFEVRAAPHITAAQQGQTQGLYTTRSFEALSAKVQHLVARQYSLYNEVLLPAFARHGIRIVTHADRSPAQKRWVHESFIREVRPLLIPVGLDPAHPFPQVANKSLNFIVRLKAQAAFGRKNEIAIVKVPRALPRLLR